MAKYSTISLLVFSALLLFLQNVYCRVIGNDQIDEEISFPLEGGSTVRSRSVGKGYQRLSHSETKSQIEEGTKEHYQIKQQDHSLLKVKHPDAHSQKDMTTTRSDSYKTETTTRRLSTTMTVRQRHPTTTSRHLRDPSLRSRREENADEHSQTGDDLDVETISSVHGKDCSCHDKELSNYELGFNSTDVLPGPFGFSWNMKAGQPVWYPQQFNPQQFVPQQFVPQQFRPQQFNPQQFNFDQWWLGDQPQGAVPGQGDTGRIKYREFE